MCVQTGLHLATNCCIFRYFPPFGKQFLLLRLIVPGIKDAKRMRVMKSSLHEDWRNALRDCLSYWAASPRNVMKNYLKSGLDCVREARGRTHTMDGARMLRESHIQTSKWQGNTDDPPQFSQISGGKLQQCPAPQLPHPSELSPEPQITQRQLLEFNCYHSTGTRFRLRVSLPKLLHKSLLLVISTF